MRLPGDFTFHKTGDPWLSWNYITSNAHDILAATQQHVILTVASVALGIAVAVPLTAIAWRRTWLRSFVLGTANAVYAVPSLAFVVALFYVFGLSRLTVIIPLAAYAQVILVRNMLTGLDEVSPEAVEAARGMGFSQRRIFWRVRVPMAVPTMIAGLRIAVVSTIELVVIGGYIGQGGYGSKIFEGYRNDYHTELMTYLLLTVLLALVADGLLLLLQRGLTPWRRGLGASA
jgi:osmoprotectant transport system permease protein